MHRDAVKTVQTCIECQKHNISKKGYHPLRPIHAYLPGDHWAIDLAGPFATSHTGNNYLLVMVDICTRFCVLRAIPDKTQDTVVGTVIKIFCDFGFPRYLQSDNGKEFVNALMKKLSEASGFDHRLATPYHPRANGVAERWVQTTTNSLRKSIKGAIRDWDLYVPGIQLALNAKVTQRTGSSPYTLMFARAMNGFKNYTEDPKTVPMTNEELLNRIDIMSQVIFPAIAERAQAVTNAQKGKFSGKYKLVKFPTKAQVMIREKQRGKLEPAYHGPYTIVRETKGGSYVLMDEQGILLPSDYPPSALKLISHDEIISLDEVRKKGKEYYVVQAIVDHKEISKGNYVYRVRWENYDEKDDTWQKPESFSSPKPIADYWGRRSTIPNSKAAQPIHATKKTRTSKRQYTDVPPVRKSKRSRQ